MALSYKIKFERIYTFLRVKNYDIMFLRQSKLTAINWLKKYEMIIIQKRFQAMVADRG